VQGLGELAQSSKKYIKGFFKWIFAGLVIGLLGGVLGAAFHICVDQATELRGAYPWLVYLLPIGGLVIAALYHISRSVLDTNLVIRAIHTSSEISPLMAPLIFVGTVISHLFGASVGREGAALQIGGTIGYQFGRLLHLDERDSHILVMCGMSAVFAANFGTPITAAFFALEVAAVGVIYYAGLIPCVTASLVAVAVAKTMGVQPLSFPMGAMTSGALVYAKVAVLGILCAVLSILFCRCLHNGERLAKKYVPNSFLRIAIGGAAAAGLTWLSGTTDYNGAGMPIINAAVAGSAAPEAFLMKMALTVLCVSVGFKGGEIIPTLFIGATFGCVVGPLLGMDASVSACLCMMGLFCAMVNCPMTSIILSIELFGSENLPFFAAICAVSYVLSGSYSLYLEQSVVYSKIKALYVNKHTR
jgi:H+/Cl- antiporter ClcA